MEPARRPDRLHGRARAGGPQGRRGAAVPDRPRRRRGARAATVATGVEAFRWLPDGRRIAFVSWVRPDLAGAAAQARAHKAFKQRKETGYATGQAQYRHWDHNLPQDRVPHLHLLELARDGRSARVRDLFEGTALELPRSDPDSSSFDVSPDGRRIAFVHDPEPVKRVGNCLALAEMDLATGSVRELARDAGWSFSAPRYSPRRRPHRLLASHQASSTPCPISWPAGTARAAAGMSSAPSGTTRCRRRCCGRTTARRCCSWPSSRVASTCGASTCPTGAPSAWSRAARCRASTSVPARW
jgi:hypothetical protein